MCGEISFTYCLPDCLACYDETVLSMDVFRLSQERHKVRTRGLVTRQSDSKSRSSGCLLLDLCGKLRSSIQIYIYGRQPCSMRWSPSSQDILTRSLYSSIAGWLSSAKYRSDIFEITSFTTYLVYEHYILAKSRYPTVADLTCFCTGVFQGLVSWGKTLLQYWQ